MKKSLYSLIPFAVLIVLLALSLLYCIAYLLVLKDYAMIDYQGWWSGYYLLVALPALAFCAPALLCRLVIPRSTRVSSSKGFGVFCMGVGVVWVVAYTLLVPWLLMYPSTEAYLDVSARLFRATLFLGGQGNVFVPLCAGVLFGIGWSVKVHQCQK